MANYFCFEEIETDNSIALFDRYADARYTANGYLITYISN